SLNFVRMNVDAHVANTVSGQSVTAADNVSVLANDSSFIYSGTGSLGVTLGKSVAINASVGLNDIHNTVSANIHAARVASTAGNVTVSATEAARDINVVVGGAVGTAGGSAFGGSLAV